MPDIKKGRDCITAAPYPNQLNPLFIDTGFLRANDFCFDNDRRFVEVSVISDCFKYSL
jgi:hypothetical protein